MEEHLDLPTGAVPLDEFLHLLQRRGIPIGQQSPAHRFFTLGRIDFAGHHTAHLDLAVLAVIHTHALDAQLLPYHSGTVPGPRAHRELNRPQRVLRLRLVPHQLAIRQASVVLRAHQQVHRPAQRLRALHQRQDVAFTVTHLHQPRQWHTGCAFGQPLIAFDPALALARPATMAVLVLGLTGPHPRIQHPQWLTVHGDGIGGMKVHATLGFVAQRAQALDGLAVEIQLGGVIQTQHNGQLSHPLHRRAAMRFHDLAPIAAVVVQHAIRRRRVTPAAAGARNAGRGLGSELFAQLDQPVVQTLVTKPHRRKLLRSPAHKVETS